MSFIHSILEAGKKKTAFSFIQSKSLKKCAKTNLSGKKKIRYLCPVIPFMSDLKAKCLLVSVTLFHLERVFCAPVVTIVTRLLMSDFYKAVLISV